jgi:hypothetical protein
MSKNIVKNATESKQVIDPVVELTTVVFPVAETASSAIDEKYATDTPREI